jgi:hypothetical protein
MLPMVVPVREDCRNGDYVNNLLSAAPVINEEDVNEIGELKCDKDVKEYKSFDCKHCIHFMG